MDEPEIVELEGSTYEQQQPDIVTSSEEQGEFLEICEAILSKDDEILKPLLRRNAEIWFKYVTLRASDCTCGSVLLEHVGVTTVQDLSRLLKLGSCEHVKTFGLAFKEDAGIQIIHWLAAHGTTPMMEMVLAAFPDLVDCPTLLHEVSPLVVAIVTENVGIVKYLIDVGARRDLMLKSRNHDIVGKLMKKRHEEENYGLGLGSIAENSMYIKKRPFLLYLISADIIKPCMLELLLQMTTWNLEQCDASAETALIFAVKNKNLQLIKVLLAARADPNFFQYEGGLVFPVLFLALSLRRGFSEIDMSIITTLLEAGADPNLMFCDSPINSISYAVQAGNHVWDPVSDDELQSDPDMSEMDTELPIMESSYQIKLRVLKLLIDYGADVNNSTPLHYAAETGSREIAEISLKAGISDLRLELTSRSTTTGRHPATALNLSAFYNHWNVLEILVRHGCNVNTSNRYGNTPLHHAATNGCRKSVELLLAFGADPDARNTEGASPLWDAVQSEQLEVCSVLLCYDVDLSVKSRGFRQNLGPEKNMVGYPGNNRSCGKVRSLLWMAVESQNPKLIDLLLSRGLNLQAEQWIINNFEETGNDDSLLKDRLNQLMSVPTSLESLCRKCVLLTCGRSVLKLPSEYKYYLRSWIL